MIKDSKIRLFEVMGRLDKTFKPKLNEEIESVESNEQYDEGSSYKAKLEEIIALAKKTYKSLPEGDIPSWVQDKIVLAKEKLSDVCGWLHNGEEHEEIEDLNLEVVDDDDENKHVEKKVDNSEEKTEEKLENDDDDDDNVEEKKSKVPVVDIAKVGK